MKNRISNYVDDDFAAVRRDAMRPGFYQYNGPDVAPTQIPNDQAMAMLAENRERHTQERRETLLNHRVTSELRSLQAELNLLDEQCDRRWKIFRLTGVLYVVVVALIVGIALL